MCVRSQQGTDHFVMLSLLRCYEHTDEQMRQKYCLFKQSVRRLVSMLRGQLRHRDAENVSVSAEHKHRSPCTILPSSRAVRVLSALVLGGAQGGQTECDTGVPENRAADRHTGILGRYMQQLSNYWMDGNKICLFMTHRGPVVQKPRLKR